MEDYEQEYAADWFVEAMTKEEGHWMSAHAGPGLSNTNCSSEVNWRIMKEALLGCAGKSGAGFSQLRTQSNLTTFIQDGRRSSYNAMAEKGQLVSFPTSGTYNKGHMIRCRDLRDLISWYANRWRWMIWTSRV